MSGEEKRDRGTDETLHGAQRLSTSRLFLIVSVFLALAAYSIWDSDRFQSLFQGVSEKRLSEILQRPVHFQRVDFQIFPPSVHLADVRVDNDPRAPDGPLLTAEELTIGGGLSVSGGELRFGRVRAIRPKISLTQFPDGSWNLPPGLSRPAEKGGMTLRIGELVVQRGTFTFEGRASQVDGRLEDFALELEALRRNGYRGTLACRKTTLDLAGAEPLVFGVDLDFRLDPLRGLAVQKMRINGEFGELRASGSVESPAHPTLLLAISGELHVAEVERIFHSRLGFEADAVLSARVRIPEAGGFEISGRLTTDQLDAKGFPIEAFEATVLARPGALVGRIERARYAGGTVSGLYRIENLAPHGHPQPMTLVLEGKGISVERFFGDLKLPGTGLSGTAAVSATLRWSEGGLERANGAARIAIEPGRPESLLTGRFGIPVGGEGDLPVVDGRIAFEAMTFRFPSSSLEATGGLRIGEWMPDFDIRLRSRDLTEIDRLFQNFVAASGGKPEPLGLGGSGEVEGHLSRSWGDPDAAVQFSAESARYGGVPFGSVRGAADMHDGAFVFHPLRAYEGAASLSLEGTTRYRPDPQRPTLDLTLTAKDYPVERFLQYLNLDFPVTGRVTGSFPLQGTPPNAVSGGGAAALDDAVLWGQKVSRITGRMVLEPGQLSFDDVRANIGGGMVGGRGSLAYHEKTFEVRAAGDAVPLESVGALGGIAASVSGKLSFEVAGSGSFDRPDLTVSASLSDAVAYGNAIPTELDPHLALRVTHGEVDASASVEGRWEITARGDMAATPAELDVGLDARDVAALLLFTPASLPVGDGGAVAARGRVRLPVRDGERISGDAVVTQARLDGPGRPGLLRTEGNAPLSLQNGRLALGELHAVGDGMDLRVRGAVDLAAEPVTVEGRLTGFADASVLTLAAPDLGLTGQLSVDLATAGPLEGLAWNGTVRIENGGYRMAGYSFEGIEGSARLAGSGGEIEALRAKVGDGEVYAAGPFRFAGGSLKDYRFALQGRRVAVRAIPALRLTVDADLVASGNDDGNQIRGQITLLRGTYSKDVELTLSDMLGAGRPEGALAAREPWKERTRLDVRIVSSAALEVRNNLARLSGSVDLAARGTLADPVLIGQVILDEGGRVVFSDIRYEIEAGTLTFSNTARIAPFVDLRARAEVKGYNLVVLLVGTWPKISANFTSDPPLANDAILGLLLSGTPPDTRNPTDTANQLVSAAGGAVAGAVTSPLRKQTQRLFGLDRFQIDPVFTGSQITTVRSTIGKQITQDLSVSSSIALDSSKDPIIRVEWQATDTIFVQLIRDENGILSISVRRRQRL